MNVGLLVVVAAAAVVLVTFKDEIGGLFYNLLTAPRTIFKRTLKWPGRGHRVQIICNTSGTYHAQYVVCYVETKGQLRY